MESHQLSLDIASMANKEFCFWYSSFIGFYWINYCRNHSILFLQFLFRAFIKGNWACFRCCSYDNRDIVGGILLVVVIYLWIIPPYRLLNVFIRIGWTWVLFVCGVFQYLMIVMIGYKGN